MVTSRQNHQHINSYYSSVVKNRIFDGKQQTPILAKEQTIKELLLTRRMNEEHQIKLPDTTYGMPVRKKMLQTNRRINDDDSIYSFKSKESSEKSFRRKPFNSTRFMTNDKTMFTGLTKAGTSGLAPFLSSGSHLIDNSIDTLDPMAGNSVLTFLDKSLH